MLPIDAGHDDIDSGSKQGPTRMVSHLLQLLNPPTKASSTTSTVGHCDHPLDPLTAEEVYATSDACKAYAAKLGIENLRFNAIALEVSSTCLVCKAVALTFLYNGLQCMLQEPTKADLLQYEASNMQIEAPQRLSTAIIQLPGGDSVVEALVDLQEEPPTVISWDQVSLPLHIVTVQSSWAMGEMALLKASNKVPCMTLPCSRFQQQLLLSEHDYCV